MIYNRSVALITILATTTTPSFSFTAPIIRVSSSNTLPRRFFASTTMSVTKFSFGPINDVDDDTVKNTLLVGKKETLKQLDLSTILPASMSIESEVWDAMMESAKEGGTVSTFVKSKTLRFGILPEKVSRNNHPLSVHTVTDLVSNLPKNSNNRIIFCDEYVSNSIGALAAAVAKAYPVYSKKTNGNNNDNEEKTKEDGHIQVVFCNELGQTLELSDSESAAASAVCEGVQLAARLVDTPPEELTTTAYAEECEKIANELSDVVTMTQIVGDELAERGYGGIHGVGRAATTPPRLVIMEYTPPEGNNNESVETIALVGKGIIYDTGGLSLKPKTGMCGMKVDMGGSAGMLGGFYSAAKLRLPNKRITLLLCLAENAIGPTAFRNDDILTLYSGKTVEVNNCDAEGRLVLGDGVAHATKHIENLDLVIDMATLTGAQLITTGKKHGGVLCNTLELEQRAVNAGLKSGDLIYPMLYAPELLKKEFDSKVADMKNSVKDRSNAQASCAGHFIESHINKDYKGGWIHCDMAGPAVNGERGTGYGVGFVLSILEAPGF